MNLNQPRTYRRTGFTLVELLTVIAIIGILAGILIPTVSSVRQSAMKARTKARFNGYATAIVQYKAEYGYYPSFGLAGGVDNRGDTLDGRNTEFFESLGAVDWGTDGFERTTNRDLNPKLISFYDFGDQDVAIAEQAAANPDISEGDLIDDFGNPDIFVAIEDENGQIKADTETGQETVNTEVVFWSDPGKNSDYEWIYSWR